MELRAIGQRTRSGAAALRDVSLTVRRGEMVAIIGGSRSGKTTLLDAMSGLRPPSEGKVIHGTPHEQVGYVPNRDTIHPILPLARALRYTAALRAVRALDGEIEDALRAADLAHKATVRVGDLEPGERKRAAIAAELLSRPMILFLEEPTTSLDPAQSTEVMRVLRELCEAGTTVVLTTQTPLDAARCDKVAVLATGGHLAFFGTPQAACGYFGADSLDEIYERLAGLGDPVEAWSRRFFQFSRASAGFTAPPTIPLQSGPPPLVPDEAGPHSAGRPATSFEDELIPPEYAVAPVNPQVRHPRLAAPPIRQFAAILNRDCYVLARSRSTQAALAGAPLAVLAVLTLLLAVGACDGSAAVALAWTVFGGLGVGAAYGALAIRGESGVFRSERFAGLSVGAYATVKLAILLPALAAADAIILAVPAVAGRLTGGYATAYVIVLIALLAGICAAALRPAAKRWRL